MSDHVPIGRLSSSGGAGVLRLEKYYDTTSEDLWSAVVDPNRLARWYGQVKGDLRQGGTFTTHLEAADIDSIGRVDVCDPPNRLRVTTKETQESWQRGQGPVPFDQTLEATLTPEGTGTRLLVEIHGLPLDRVASYGAGWHIHLESLAAYLTGAAPIDAGVRWQTLLPSYQQLATELS